MMRAFTGSLFLVKEALVMGIEAMNQTKKRVVYPEDPQFQELSLERTDPEDIADYLKNNWDRSVTVDWPEEGKNKVIIPADWDHGAGREFDALVHFENGILTTKTISGKYIEIPDFLHWTGKHGFHLYTGEQKISPDHAAFILSTDIARYDRKPLVEMRRTADDGVPVSLQIFGTLRSSEMKDVSKIGNGNPALDKRLYTGRIQEMMRSFAPLGTTRKKKELGIPPDWIEEGIYDDLYASAATTEAVEKIRRSLGLWPKNVYRQLKGVGMTPLAATVFITRADMTGDPLIAETFAFGGGLGGETHNLNYILHTDSDLLAECGSYVFGDVGDHTAFPGIEEIEPNINEVNGGSNRHRHTYCLRGGESMRRIAHEILCDPKLGKEGRKVLEIILGAGRANKGSDEYAVGVNGVDVLQQLPL
jgi:hypothetical protein